MTHGHSSQFTLMMDNVMIGNDCEACSGCGNVSQLIGADNTTTLDQQVNDSGKTYDTYYPLSGKKINP